MSAASENLGGDAAERRSPASVAGAIEICMESSALSLPLCGKGALPDADDPASILHVAEGEPIVAALLLRESNGPIYDALEPADGLVQAIERIGCDGARQIICGLNDYAPRLDPDEVLGRAVRESRTGALAVSRTGARIAEAAGHPELASQVALLGLLCNVGVPFLAAALSTGAREHGDAPELNDFATGEILAELSERCGHRLLVRWNLAPWTLAVLQNRAVEADERRLATLLGMARAVVASIGRATANREDASEWSRALWDHAEALGLSDVAVAALQVHAEDDVTDVEAAYSGSDDSE